MALDSQDFELLKTIRKAIREGDALTHDFMKRAAQREAQSLQVQQQMLEAFNRLAVQMETLTAEVREMRRELTPPLEKPKRGPIKPPATGKGG
ncbi:MAG: hypothetical protein GC185_03055 [Alphaproteobacteria bacterium]|nr:hypothetical protein [Alphaproteobacteria bacterium]